MMLMREVLQMKLDELYQQHGNFWKCSKPTNAV